MNSIPDADLSSLEVGCISASRSAIVGGESTLFAFEGATGRHGQYMNRKPDPIGESWAESTGALHARLSPRLQTISLFIPNKESCLPDLYPLPLGVTPGRSWAKTRQMLSGDPGILFGDALVDASRPNGRSERMPWLRTDSHPSDLGTMVLANELLGRLGVAPLGARIEEIPATRFEGDLSGEWGPIPVGESFVARIVPDGPVPIPVEGGRVPEWSNPDAMAPMRLVIVGDGHSGSGTQTRHLTRWMASIFATTVVVDAPVVPVDILEELHPDVVVYQAAERHMTGMAPAPGRLSDVVPSRAWRAAP